MAEEATDNKPTEKRPTSQKQPARKRAKPKIPTLREREVQDLSDLYDFTVIFSGGRLDTDTPTLDAPMIDGANAKDGDAARAALEFVQQLHSWRVVFEEAEQRAATFAVTRLGVKITDAANALGVSRATFHRIRQDERNDSIFF